MVKIMSIPFASIIAIPMIALLFYRFEYAKFLAPLWMVLFIVSSGLLTTLHGAITALSCAVVAVLVAISMFKDAMHKKASKSSNAKGSDDDLVESDSAHPARSRITRHEGLLSNFGMDHWKHDKANDMSFFVEVNDKTIWAIGLKDAVENSGANVGDTVAFWKETEVRTSKAQMLDKDGKVTGYRDLAKEKRRGIWHMEIIG